MENKTKEELVELVRAQVAVIDGLTLELATRQPAAPAAPLVTVDTPELQRLLELYRLSSNFTLQSNFHGQLTAHIDAHIARAVAAERERAARLAIQWGNARQDEGGGNALRAYAEALRNGVDVDERDSDYHHSKAPAQPVAGELPPLPEPEQ